MRMSVIRRDGTSYLLGAMVPVMPYLFAATPIGIAISALATVGVLFGGGAAKTLITTR